MTLTRTTSETLRDDENGDLEKRCGHCLEWWPADLEFFFRAPDGVARLQSWCRACLAEARNDHNRRKRAQRDATRRD